jgi:hypothetical protein
MDPGECAGYGTSREGAQHRNQSGVRFTENPPLPGTELARVSTDITAGTLWAEIARTKAFKRELIATVDTVVGGAVGEYEQTERLRSAGVEPVFASVCSSLADETRARFWDALKLPEQYGSAQPSLLGFHLGLPEIVDGPLAPIRAAGRVPTVVIEVDDRFEDLTAEQRRDVCRLLSDLGTTFEVVIVASGYWQRKLVRKYGDELPAGVGETITAIRPGIPPAKEREAIVDRAIDRFDPKGAAPAICRMLADEEGVVPYHTLYATIPIANGSVRERLSVLEAADLVERGELSDGSGCVELLDVGETFVATADERWGRQTQFDASSDHRQSCSKDPPHSSDNKRVCQAWEGRETPSGGETDRPASAALGRLRFLNRWEHEAAVACAAEGEIGIADHVVRENDFRPVFSYDESRDELVAGATYKSTWGWLVGTATALVSGEMWNEDGPLPASRIDGSDTAPSLASLCGGSRRVWTMAAQGGWLSKDVTDGAAYIEVLRDVLDEIHRNVAARSHLLARGEYDEAATLTGEIMAECQGLIGTVTALLDECGVSFTRYLEIPDYRDDHHSTNDCNRRRTLLRTITLMCSISSKYGAYTAQRTMREDRPSKRAFTLGTPDVTPDQTGRLIGSLTIVGQGVSTLVSPASGPSLPEALDKPGQFIEDGYNAIPFDVPIEIRSDRERSIVARAVRRMCREKNLLPTTAATGLFDGLCGSIFAITRALNRLTTETKDRDRPIRLDEVRRVLGTVPARSLLTDHSKPSLGKLLQALFTAETPLSKAELAERADCSRETVRRRSDELEALAIATRRVGGAGLADQWVCTLPTREDRAADPDDDRTPWVVEPTTDGAGVTGKSFDHMLYDLATTLCDAAGDSDPPPSLEEFDGVVRDEPRLCREVPALRAWLPVIASLTNVDLRRDAFDIEFPAELAMGRANLGEPPAQTRLPAGQEVVA